MKALVAGLIVGGAILAAILAGGQKGFAPSRFEFGVVRGYAGVLETTPVPILWTAGGPYLLVASGKHGAQFPRDAYGQRVTLEGSLIERDSRRMIEVRDGSLAVQGPADTVVRWNDMGDVTLRGEIVDSKCFLGVMNPGEGKVHRACAARCIRGGVPASLSVANRLVLLVGDSSLGDFAGESVVVRGRLLRAESIEVLRLETTPERRE